MKTADMSVQTTPGARSFGHGFKSGGEKLKEFMEAARKMRTKG